MSIKFDTGYQYQFVLFYEEIDSEPSEIKLLPDLISQQVPNSKSLGLKFGKKERQQGLIIPKPGLPPVQTLEWSVGSGVWRMVWSPLRLDLYFDATAFSEITESEVPTLRQAVDRVASNLAEVVKVSSRNINRLALVLTAKGSDQEARAATGEIGKRFFNEGVNTQIGTGGVRDLTARVNLTAEYVLPTRSEDRPVRVNQIEQASMTWQYEDGGEVASLSWLLDVNTSPASLAPNAFSPASIRPFYGNATSWITERLNQIEGR